jgi:hypothetical protein
MDFFIPSFDPNQFYRITCTAIGNTFSLDVISPPTVQPSGMLNLTQSGPFSGQFWQVLSTKDTMTGTFYLASQFLGAQKKLDVAAGVDSTLIPFMKNFSTTSHDQTWMISHWGNETEISNNTFYIAPSIFGGQQVLTVDNSTKSPYLTTIGADNQNWMFTAVGSINDASFSAAELETIATSVCSVLPPNNIIQKANV